MPMLGLKYSNGTDFNVCDVEIHVSNGRISSVVFTDAFDGRQIMLSASAEGVTFGGISTPYCLSSGFVRIGRKGMSIFLPPSK